MRSVKEAKVKGRRVIVRVDFNVPIKTGKVADDSKIVASLPTIKLLIKKGAKVILISHLGRPEGVRTAEFSLMPVSKRLSRLLGKGVKFVSDCASLEVQKSLSKMRNGDVILLENVRFYSQEENNDDAFGKYLASLGDVFVSDAFGVSHRKNASVCSVTKYIPSYAGLLLEKEVNSLSVILKNPKRPFIVILGGAKVSDKIGLIENVLKKADMILLGGAIAATFLKSLGIETGKTKIELNMVGFARKLLKNANGKIALPIDVVGFDKRHVRVFDVNNLPKSFASLDIGPMTAKIYSQIVMSAKTVFWNGPLGLFEKRHFGKGSITVGEALAKSGATSIVGGGDTLFCLGKLSKRMSFSSTGGGASLEFLENKHLPGLKALSYYGSAKKRV